MTSLQAIKWFHEGFRYFLIKMIFILVIESVLYTGKSPLGAPFIQWDALNCPLSVNPLMITIWREYRSLNLHTVIRSVAEDPGSGLNLHLLLFSSEPSLEVSSDGYMAS